MGISVARGFGGGHRRQIQPDKMRKIRGVAAKRSWCASPGTSARGPAPAGTPRRQRVAVQFSSDLLMVAAVAHGEKASVGRFSFQLATMPDLILLKLAAAEEPKRRTSQKIHDVGDVVRLLEDHPELDFPEIRSRLGRIRSTF